MTIIKTILEKNFPDETGNYSIPCSIKEILFNGNQITGMILLKIGAKIKEETIKWFIDNMRWRHVMEAERDENLSIIVWADFEMTYDDARKIANIMRDL